MTNLLNEFRSTSITWDKATSRIYSPVTANASDENGRKLVVQIVNGGQVEDLTGATLHLYWITRDKAHDGLDVFDAVDLKNGEFELSYTTGMLSNQGVLNANLVLIDTVGRVVSERFKITVTEGIDNDAIQSENSFSSLTQALIDISNLEQNYAPRLNDLTAQLAQTDAEARRKKELEDLSPTVLAAIEGGEGTSFNLLSIPQDYSVTQEKTTFVNVGKNIFNKDNVETGKMLNATTGLTANNAAYSTSDFISISPNTEYTQNQAWLSAFYDSSKTFISGLANTSPTTTTRTFTTPANAKYVRLSVSNAEINGYQVEIGDSVTPYESFRYEYKYLHGSHRDEEQDRKLALQDLLNKYSLKYFTLYDESATPGVDLETKLKIYSAFQYVKITGSDADKPHNLRYIARNMEMSGYRFIIERKDDSGWVQLIDTNRISLTENQYGVSILNYSDAQYSIEMHIDYRLFPDNPYSTSFSNPLGDTQFVFTKEAFGVVGSGGGGGEAYDQSLNTTDDVIFKSVTTPSLSVDALATTGTLPMGTLSSPPTGLLSGDAWADTTDNSEHPILRVKL